MKKDKTNATTGITRGADLITSSADMEHLCTFSDFPVFMGCANTPLEDDLVSSMSWWISRKSGMIQLDPVLPLEMVYKEAHGSGTVGTLWRQHHKAFSEFILRYADKINNILEIGGQHGYLGRLILNNRPDLKWTIVEPNPSEDIREPLNLIKGWFDENFKGPNDCDAIVHSHVFEHVYSPHRFMRAIAAFMKTGALSFFSIPNMRAMLEKNYSNCLNFEHTYFLDEVYVDYFIETYGFEVVEKEYFRDDHSIFYGIRKNSNSRRAAELPPKLYKKHKELWTKYAKDGSQLSQKLNTIIAEATTPIYLFGGHIFSQWLIAHGLQTDKIVGILDNDVNKHGKRLYGTHLQVSSPAILSNEDGAVVILRAGVYTEEIKHDILTNINPKIEFVP